MSGPLDLKRWERCKYAVKGEDGATAEISMELRRLRRHESKPLRKALLSVFRQIEKTEVEDLTNSQKGEIMAAIYDEVGDEQIRQWFETLVRDVRGLSVDGAAITTGGELLSEVADDGMISFVLLKLADLARLTPAEGKGSASRSTSPLAMVESSSASAARSTESEALIVDTTATETPADSELSSVLTEA